MNYKEKYKELMIEHNKLREQIETSKSKIIKKLYKKLKVKDKWEIHTSYGYFLWKLTIEELLYLNKKLNE